MRAALRVKGGSLPGRESVNQPLARDAGHQIHLAWGDQAADDGLHRDPVRGKPDVIFFEQLGYWIVAGNVEHDGVGAYIFSMHIV